MEKENMIPKHHENNFAFLHWLGIVLVLLGHQYVLMGQAAPRILNMECHNLGVRMLFVVSGYLVMESYSRSDSAGRFLGKRIVRLFPGLIICTFGMALIIGPGFTTLSLGQYFANCKRFIVKNILMFPTFDLPGVFADNPYPVSMNGSLWTLPIEFACYLLIPLVFCIFRLIKKINSYCAYMFGGIFCLLTYGIYVLREYGISTSRYVVWGTDWLNAFSVIIYFLLGCLFSCLGLKKILNLQWSIVVVLVYMLVPGSISTIIRPIAITYVTLALAFSSPAVLGKKLSGFTWYYACYLWSFPLQQCMISILVVRFGKYIDPAAMFLVSFIIVFIVGWFVTKCVEEPFIRGIKNKWNRVRLK